MLGRLVFTLLVGFAGLGFAGEGQACSRPASIWPVEPRVIISNADAAFVGTLARIEPTVARPTPTGPGPFAVSAEPYRLTYRVEEVIKGALGDTVEVVTYIDGGLCGLPARLGERYGLPLKRQEGVWKPSTGDVYDPELLRRGALPLPEPSGSGPPRLLATGAFGEARVATLDELGRVLRYGQGRGAVTAAAVCPGGKRMIELVNRDGTLVLARRRLPSLELISERELQPAFGSDAFCVDRDASDALLVLSVYGPDRAEARLSRVSTIGTRVIERGASLSAAVRDKTVFVSFKNGDLTSRDLETGRRRLLARTGEMLTGISVSPQRRYLSGFSKFELVILEVDTGAVRSRPRTATWGAETRWVGSEQLVAWSGAGADGRLDVLNARFLPLRRPVPWSWHVLALGVEPFGIERFSMLRRIDPTGNAVSLGPVFSPGIFALTVLSSS